MPRLSAVRVLLLPSAASVRKMWRRSASSRLRGGGEGAVAPAGFSLVGTRGGDSVTLTVRVDHALATEMATSTFRRLFFQMRGRFTLGGRLAGTTVSDSGQGFFETYRSR